ncbi:MULTISPECIES: helix-turn-helix domain-containing protein [unclassified Acinetobacter]|uniref:winged helix-turn-helix transcriptional regulator n=1 Tax=unclassified Acinetobacter TaxID=196816 RepID=UPI0024488B4D|nr:MULTISPECIES: helix-turn-helix domain-containing protein [unclassified Acinetobacter]MDH0030712.1 helix-turn-helix transcriptional regulator [Acinetobacter sp. GD04021]MDH0886178.1 helix-turn-helix transcriptional regulator [Acinetobacter sp. GD03873]MDH1081848.1 helix-turn-helix transcriptional regulator [Acinetobacter sp. GD03983]MDH2189655.1 helix-turn-helix transcriptional regulator [Acinetobacter sp. GD03645]MDH2202647.1 helix-turn-helix transcriptional regulator [Acinetobacter sp. GD0
MNQALKYDIYQQHCPARLFFEKIADKWVLLIINILSQETQHFNLLKKNIQGISPKVLSQKLKMLERDGFIERQVQNTSPIRVDYSLTLLGIEVAKMAYQLKDWAESNIEQVISAQQRFDATQQQEM